MGERDRGETEEDREGRSGWEGEREGKGERMS